MDSHSTQLDILIYNSAKYPVFQRFGENVIVPPEGVVGIISVKKKLHETDIVHEIEALKAASKLCRCVDDNDQHLRGPFLALVSMDAFVKKEKTTEQWIFEKLEGVYSKEENYFDDLVGYIGSFNKWSIFKKRPKNGKVGEYIFFNHREDEAHMGFQFLLTGILSVYCDKTRNYISMDLLTAKVGTITERQDRMENKVDSIQKDVTILADNFITDKDKKNFVLYKGQKLEADIAYIENLSASKENNLCCGLCALPIQMYLNM